MLRDAGADDRSGDPDVEVGCHRRRIDVAPGRGGLEHQRAGLCVIGADKGLRRRRSDKQEQAEDDKGTQTGCGQRSGHGLNLRA